jgi:hypothetical protein
MKAKPASVLGEPVLFLFSLLWQISDKKQLKRDERFTSVQFYRRFITVRENRSRTMRQLIELHPPWEGGGVIDRAQLTFSFLSRLRPLPVYPFMHLFSYIPVHPATYHHAATSHPFMHHAATSRPCIMQPMHHAATSHPFMHLAASQSSVQSY